MTSWVTSIVTSNDSLVVTRYYARYSSPCPAAIRTDDDTESTQSVLRLTEGFKSFQLLLYICVTEYAYNYEWRIMEMNNENV